MRNRGIVAVVLVFATAALAAGVAKFNLEQTWTHPDFQRRPFKKLLVIGISDDRETRHRFEDKFVSHLRGRGVQAATSYSIVPDLTVQQDQHIIVQTIEEQRIDAAISVRLVPMKGLDKAAWSARWQQQVEADGDLRELIDDSLPLLAKKAKNYGVEVALWETAKWDRIWAGRTETYKRDELKKGAGDFVQYVMDSLTFAELLEPRREQ
jgi:hypothetical protein